jgi:hypothetical protein
MNWIMEHMEDSDFNDPLPVSGTAGASGIYIDIYIYIFIYVYIYMYVYVYTYTCSFIGINEKINIIYP